MFAVEVVVIIILIATLSAVLWVSAPDFHGQAFAAGPQLIVGGWAPVIESAIAEQSGDVSSAGQVARCTMHNTCDMHELCEHGYCPCMESKKRDDIPGLITAGVYAPYMNKVLSRCGCVSRELY